MVCHSSFDLRSIHGSLGLGLDCSDLDLNLVQLNHSNFITSLECKGKFRVIRICPKFKNELNLTILNWTRNTGQ